MGALHSLANSAGHHARVRRAVDLACQVHGRQRGFAAAADALGVSYDTARAIGYGRTNGATVPEHRADAALLRFRTSLQTKLRAELAALEDPHEETAVVVLGPYLRGFE
jgi:hypothetical protein